MDPAAIMLPGGVRLPPIPGRYFITPPPDLNEVDEMRFLLEYDFPHLIVETLARPRAYGEEQRGAQGQSYTWRKAYPRVGGSIGGCLEGYQLPEPASGAFHRQFVPDLSYIDAPTWSHITDEDRDKAYIPCAPAVAIELVTPTETMEELQAKVAKYVDAGTREAVVVDTRQNRVWIHNRNEQPYFDTLAPIEFDSWPGFTLDCEAIRDARIRRGLR